MNKTDTKLKKDILKILNDMARECGWIVVLTDKEEFRILNSKGSIVYTSRYPTDIAFYMNGTKETNVFN